MIVVVVAVTRVDAVREGVLHGAVGRGRGVGWFGCCLTSRLGDFCVHGRHIVGLGSLGRLAGRTADVRGQGMGSCSARASDHGVS